MDFFGCALIVYLLLTALLAPSAPLCWLPAAGLTVSSVIPVGHVSSVLPDSKCNCPPWSACSPSRILSDQTLAAITIPASWSDLWIGRLRARGRWLTDRSLSCLCSHHPYWRPWTIALEFLVCLYFFGSCFLYFLLDPLLHQLDQGQILWALRHQRTCWLNLTSCIDFRLLLNTIV